jgi:hypothetical protein
MKLNPHWPKTKPPHNSGKKRYKTASNPAQSAGSVVHCCLCPPNGPIAFFPRRAQKAPLPRTGTFSLGIFMQNGFFTTVDNLSPMAELLRLSFCM